MKRLIIAVSLMTISGCAIVTDKAGELVDKGMQGGRDSFCGGTFPLASYNKFLQANGKTWSELGDWCEWNIEEPISDIVTEESEE